MDGPWAELSNLSSEHKSIKVAEDAELEIEVQWWYITVFPCFIHIIMSNCSAFVCSSGHYCNYLFRTRNPTLWRLTHGFRCVYGWVSLMRYTALLSVYRVANLRHWSEASFISFQAESELFRVQESSLKRQRGSFQVNIYDSTTWSLGGLELCLGVLTWTEITDLLNTFLHTCTPIDDWTVQCFPWDLGVKKRIGHLLTQQNRDVVSMSQVVNKWQSLKIRSLD